MMLDVWKSIGERKENRLDSICIARIRSSRKQMLSGVSRL